MKKLILLLFLFLSLSSIAQQQTATYSINPATFEETTSITITINGSSINESTWGVTGNALYLWAWAFDLNDTTQKGTPLNGSWTASDEASKFTYNVGSDTYTKTFVPTTYYNTTNIGKIGFLIKAKDGTGDKKSQDILAEVGSFQVTLTSPAQNSTTILATGGSLSIAATNTNGVANYILKSNGVSINTNASTSSYAFNHTNITSNQNYELEVTQSATTVTKKFTVVINPNTVSETIPVGLVDGINYNPNDATKATLVLDAPLKDFVYVAGSFNNWQPDNLYAMKKDATLGSTKFWLELTGLVSGVNNTYQYWVGETTPIANSPALVKTADPYSTLVLSPFDDPGIPVATYPNMPVYPAGQEREVTVLQTGQTPYVWSAATTNFVKPEKDKLVVYEVLVRDFDANRNYQDLINRIDYFKNLKINAIQLMPIMEFEGNESWGYNTSFHMALDKFYGPSTKLKELIDLCHQNGIAVILDVALNHSFGRNPMIRMWMNDPEGDGWGSPTTENPYYNTAAMHSYSVGEDFNHQQPRTQNYVKRVVKQWIEEYKIDGFRWDLTKGFTQNCPSNVAGGQDACTGNYQQDRVDVLKAYADYSWSLDATHYTIFEHLGGNTEEQQWANYRINDPISKGVMMWGNMNSNYNELSMGYTANISGMTSQSRGFTANRLMGYAESHDEERLMYKNGQFGNSTNTAHNVKTLNVALSRMSAIGAVSLLIPGPKMIWHFGELGWEKSIFTCNNGTVNDNSSTIAGDCKLDTKPQPQWTNNWLADNNRNKIYYDWARMIGLKTSEAVFSGMATVSNTSSLTPNIKITNSALASTDLKDVLIIANFDVTAKNVSTGFQYTGSWYNLMDNTPYTVTDMNATISLQPGEFRIYGNKTSTLATTDFDVLNDIYIYPNPASNYFVLNTNTTKVQIYAISGQLVKTFDKSQAKDHQYNVSDLESGMYFVRIYNEENKVKVMKFIKQ
ncbi:Secretion system C-terminal sorting domain [Flavobacteriaceae bacterium]